MSSIVLFLRKKSSGENSIEEITRTLVSEIPGIELVTFPEHSTTVHGIYRNILFARRHAGDINHFITPGEMYITPFIRGKSVVTWHDVGTALQSPSAVKKFIRAQVLMGWPMRYVDRLTAISEYAKQEVVSLYGQHLENEIDVIYNAYNSAFAHSPKAFNATCPQILHIGTGKRKNLNNVIQALHGLECHLCIVGKLHDTHRNMLQRYQISYTQEQDVPFSRIIELYRSCDIVSFPSLYEGFGMPIIEAQATGRVVLTSRRASIPEVAAETVHYVDPESVEDIAHGFRMLINNSEYRERLVSFGLENAKRFETQKMIQAYKAVYAQLADR